MSIYVKVRQHGMCNLMLNQSIGFVSRSFRCVFPPFRVLAGRPIEFDQMAITVLHRFPRLEIYIYHICNIIYAGLSLEYWNVINYYSIYIYVILSAHTSERSRIT